MADETFIDLGVQGDSKDVEKFASSLEKVIKALDKLTDKLNKVIKATNDSTNTTKDDTKATDDNTESTKKNTSATEKNTSEKKKQNDELKKAVGGFFAFTGAVAGAISILNRLTTDLAKSNQAMLNLTRQTDIALSTFQKWDGLGKLFGIENAEQQLASLNEKIFNLKLTGEGARGFQLAGIMPTTANDVLEQLRNRVSGMSDTAATYLLQQMGIDPQMLTLLRMSRSEFEELGKTIEKYQLKPEQRIEIQKLNGQMQLVNIQFQYFKDKAILALMPHLVSFMQALARITEMFANLLDNIKNSTAMRATTVGFGYFLLNIRKIAAGFLVLSRNTTKFNAVFLKIGKTCAGVAGFFKQFSLVITELIAKIPIFGKVFAALGGIFKKALLPLYAAYLLLDDLAVFFQGGDSLIGRVMEWGKEKGGEISEAFGKMFGGDLLGGASDLLQSLLDVVTDIQGVCGKILERIVSFLTLGLSDTDIGQKIMNFFTGKDQLEKLKKQIEDKENNRVSYVPNLTAADQFISNYNSSKTSNVTNSPNIVQNVEITTDAPIDMMQRQLRQSNAMATRLG